MSIEIEGPGTARAQEPAPALNRDILDALTTMIKCAGSVGHSVASGFGVAPHDLLAMFKLEGGLPMKELAQRMGCDASFITVIADALEKRGFARREPSLRDRRVKNLALTEEGLAAKERMLAQLAAKMPWCYALDEKERNCLLFLIRKMLDTPEPDNNANYTDEASHDCGPGEASAGTPHPRAPDTAGAGGVADM
jgi:DNA-binding MarR family transcriptional regulator